MNRARRFIASILLAVFMPLAVMAVPCQAMCAFATQTERGEAPPVGVIELRAMQVDQEPCPLAAVCELAAMGVIVDWTLLAATPHSAHIPHAPVAAFLSFVPLSAPPPPDA